MDELTALIATGGSLFGVLVGGLLAERASERSWRREQLASNRTERRDVYSRFLVAARLWQSNVLEPGAMVRTDPRGRIAPYVDAGAAYGQTIQALAEIRLVALGPAIVNAAAAWDDALRELGRVQAATSESEAIKEALEGCRQAEQNFVRLARGELEARAAR
jgi:hypothetical protein